MPRTVVLRQWLLNGATVAVTVVALGVGGIRIQEHYAARNADPSRPVHVDMWRSYQEVGHRRGPANARVTIVEFADFQCPFCRAVAADLVELQQRYPELAVVYRHYPIPGHKYAMAAAIAAVCAGRSGHFEAFHDILFLEQDSIGVKTWPQFARQAGVPDMAVFESCLSDSLAVRAVDVDRSAGDRLGVDGTPTLLINDLKITGYPGRQKLESYVQAMLHDD